MWVFVLGDMVIFAMYFIVYMVERGRQPAVFLASQQDLNQNIGLINTLLMLTSSWFVARSVLAARAGKRQQTVRLVEAGALCGVLFILVKIYEWWSEISHGHTLVTNEFFTWYFIRPRHLVLRGGGADHSDRRAPGPPAPPPVPGLPGGVGSHLLAHGGPALDRDLRVDLRDAMKR